MAARRYRFSWEHEKSRFEPPGVFAELDQQDPVRQLILRIVENINKQSGAKQLAGWVLVAAHYLLLIVLLVIYCFVESGLRSNMTGFLLFAVPFLSFVPIVYAMVRDRPLAKITKYMEKNEQQFNEDLGHEKYHLTSLFISGHTLKGKAFSFVESSFLGYDFSGFLEFEDRKYMNEPDRPRLLGTRSAVVQNSTFGQNNQTSNQVDHGYPHQKVTANTGNSGSNKHSISMVHQTNNQQYIMDHPFNNDWNSKHRPPSAASQPQQPEVADPLWTPTAYTKRPNSPSGPPPNLQMVQPMNQ